MFPYYDALTTVFDPTMYKNQKQIRKCMNNVYNRNKQLIQYKNIVPCPHK